MCSKTVKRRLTVKGAIHTNPRLTYFPSAAAEFRNWLLNLLLRYQEWMIQMSKRSETLRDEGYDKRAKGKLFLANLANYNDKQHKSG